MPIGHWNVLFAWAWFAVGIAAGAAQGLRFHDDQWLGGYGSWPRRLTRLGHVSFFGTGLLNLGFAVSTATAAAPSVAPLLTVASAALVAGGVAMPAVCYLSAFHRPLRRWFPVPVTLLAIGVVGTLAALISAPVSRGGP